MNDIKHRRCPECGDADHLYAKADAKWDRITGAWIIAEWAEDGVECTTCDWSGQMDDTAYSDEPEGCGQCESTGTTQSASNGEAEPCPVCDGSGGEG